MNLIKSILDTFVNCSGSWMHGLYHASVIVSIFIIVPTFLLDKYSIDHRDEVLNDKHTVFGLIIAGVIMGFIPILNMVFAAAGLFSIKDFIIRMKLKKQNVDGNDAYISYDSYEKYRKLKIRSFAAVFIFVLFFMFVYGVRIITNFANVLK